ncbi:hypothetical protein [Streptomyces europaeiscabiei]|uniref:hypothetical protein n=1 Tax=Streptomyces europaeiscabiei TaxID=146819 RepID=UPI0029BB595C|nr:hypothetical protein [Streptomyces europaeiscabiei]MDX2523850.1 hypothetical protein [Streptomyces europaeiscabiei]MDX2766176.1 hypothetical protein [Streptomyces europaeiscabiei]
MRRTARPLTATALAVAAAALAAAPAYGGEGTGRLELSPAGVVPGDEVIVRTAACGADGTAAGDAGAVGAGSFSLAPGSGQRQLDGRFEVPPSAQPGTYEIVATCVDGGRRVTGDLVVSLTGTRTAQPTYPRGSVKTGVGGALGPDPVQTAAGVAALAVAAAGGTWLLHRRARGDGI